MRAKTDAEYETTKENLVKHLSEGVCHFSFRNAKDEVREAYGTTRGDILPPNYTRANVSNLLEKARDLTVALGTGTIIQSDIDSLAAAQAPFGPREAKAVKPRPDTSVNFFDINKQAWRSCNSDKLIIIY